MRTAICLVSTIFTLAPVAAQQEAETPTPVPIGTQPQTPTTHFTFGTGEFDSPSIDAKRTQYAIYLPRDYADAENAAKRYPLVIWLHGMNGSYERFHQNGGPEILETLRAKDEIPDLIFVALSTSRRPLYMNGVNGGDYEDLITKDLMTHLEADYRLSERREHRAIMGVSIGGMGALRLALRNPNLFGTVAAHSAVVLPASYEDAGERLRRRVDWMIERGGLDAVLGDPVDPAKWKDVAPSAMVRAMAAEELGRLRIYFDAGTEDRYGLAPDNEALSALLKEKGVAHEFELVEGGGHAWGSGATQRQLPKSLRFVAAAFRALPEARDAEPATPVEPK